MIGRTLTIMKLSQQEKYGRDSLAERQWNGMVDTLKSEGLFHTDYFTTRAFCGDGGDFRGQWRFRGAVRIMGGTYYQIARMG